VAVAAGHEAPHPVPEPAAREGAPSSQGDRRVTAVVARAILIRFSLEKTVTEARTECPERQSQVEGVDLHHACKKCAMSGQSEVSRCHVVETGRHLEICSQDRV